MSGATSLRSGSPAQTEAIGAAIGAVLRAGDVLILSGPLGAGKTCLVRGIVAGAGGDPAAVRSPTFVIHQPHRGRTLTVHHADLYRLGPGADIGVLDLDGALEQGAVVVEWGEYGDLGRHHPATLTIAAGSADDERVLALEDGGPGHVLAAWSALTASVS